MRVVYIGSKGMGRLALEELARQQAEGQTEVIAVVAREDDPQPGQWYPSVTERAEELGLEVLKPRDINAPEFVEQMRALRPDLLFTAFYPKLYKRPLLEVAPAGSVNLHFAPLPRYRGSYPGAWAIIRGETRHGVTMHYMTPGCDSGDLIGQEFVEIAPDETGLTLYEKCEAAGLALVRRVWPALVAGRAERTPQDESQALYHDRNYPYGGVVNWGWSAREVDAYVRAMTFPPFPNPFTFFDGRKLTILKSSLGEASSGSGDAASDAREPGTVLGISDALEVQTRRGVVRLHEFQDSRGRVQPLEAIVRSYGLSPGKILGR
jgi:UDP-4-amino-4-deoxy-L-arabinose formyltransferase/UDP-glucuronic acid dehydrogenase (UDP-4-keto-hexauronic acid decarboxylating)